MQRTRLFEILLVSILDVMSLFSYGYNQHGAPGIGMDRKRLGVRLILFQGDSLLLVFTSFLFYLLRTSYLI